MLSQSSDLAEGEELFHFRVSHRDKSLIISAAEKRLGENFKSDVTSTADSLMLRLQQMCVLDDVDSN